MKWILVLAIIMCFATTACSFNVPISDPMSSPVDHRLDGLWIQYNESDSTYLVALIAPMDEHVHCVIASQVTVDKGVVKADSLSEAFRAWTTDAGIRQFLNLERVTHLIPNNKVDRPFTPFAISIDEPGGVLQLFGIAGRFKNLDNVSDSAEFRKIVEGNSYDPALVSNEPLEFHRCRADVKDEAAIQAAFSK